MGGVYCMSRLLESKIQEFDQHIDDLERKTEYLYGKYKELRRANDVIKELRIVELAYKDKCQCGVETINRLLEDGFEIHKQFQTESGIVVELAMWSTK